MTKYINPFIAYYDTNGEPLSGGKLNFYEAGTTNPEPVYADQDLTVALSNPVVADSDGRFEAMYMQKISYKIVLTDANDVIIKTEDNYDFTNQVLFDDIKQSATTTYEGVVELATVEEVTEGTDNTKAVTPYAISEVVSSLVVSPKSYMVGLLPKNAADVDHDITIEVGNCRNATNDGDINLDTEITKQSDTVWQEGTDMGGMPATVTKTGTFNSSGTAITGISSAFLTEFKVGDILYSSSNVEYRRITDITNDTDMTLESTFTSSVTGDNVQKNGLAKKATYYIFVISKNDGTVDAGYDTQLNAENLLADANVTAAEFIKYRRNGAMVTDSSANFYEVNTTETSGGGCMTSYLKGLQDYAVTNISGADLAVPISVPIGIDLGVNIQAYISSSSSRAMQIRGTYEETTVITDVASSFFDVSATSGATTGRGSQYRIVADGNLTLRANTTNTVLGFNIRTNDYSDARR